MNEHTGRLYLLDFTRGVAAFAVVLWHYQHFYFDAPGHLADNFVRSSQPFYQWLWLFYQEGSRGVYLFFVLSGFVFFSQYSDKIRTRAVNSWQFFIRRFSRLYPLHFVTLVIVYVLQLGSKYQTGEYTVYHCNDLRRGLLSVTFLTDWLPDKFICSTLNGPTWSLSAEVFLYVVFFGVALLLPRNRLARAIGIIGIIVASLLIYIFDGYHLLGEPALCFFAGGFVWLLWNGARRDHKHTQVLLAAAAVAFLASYQFTIRVSVSNLMLDAILFPSLVLVLACLQVLKPTLGRPVRSFGDISYAVYLLHFPLQLAIIVCLRSLHSDLDFNQHHVWLIFFAGLTILSYVSFYAFELPAQKKLRAFFINRSPAAVVADLRGPRPAG